MFKRSLGIFALILLGLVAWFGFVRDSAKQFPQLLSLAVSEMDFIQYDQSSSQLVLIQPNGNGERILHRREGVLLNTVFWTENNDRYYYDEITLHESADAESFIYRQQFHSPQADKIAAGNSARVAPNGRDLVYITDDMESGRQIIVIETNGQRWSLDDYVVTGSEPDWLSDGEWVFFVGYPVDTSNIYSSGNLVLSINQIYRAHRSGEPIEQLTDTPTVKYRPLVSPNGQWILFYVAGRESTEDKLIRIDSDGQNPQSFSYASEDLVSIQDFDWSSDSQEVVYIAETGLNGNYTLGFVQQDSLTTELIPLPQRDWVLDVEFAPFTNDIVYYSVLKSNQVMVYRFDRNTRREQAIYTYISNSNLAVIQLSWTAPIDKIWHRPQLAGGSVIHFGMAMLSVYWQGKMKRARRN